MSEATVSSGQGRKVYVVLLGHNSSGFRMKEERVDAAKLKLWAKDPHGSDCPLLELLGFPVMLVSAEPGAKVGGSSPTGTGSVFPTCARWRNVTLTARGVGWGGGGRAWRGCHGWGRRRGTA